MTGSRPFTMIAALIFLVMALVHGYRLATQFQVVMGRHVIPQWVSWVGLVVPAILAWGLWKEAKS